MSDFDWGSLLGSGLSAAASIYTADQQKEATDQAAEQQRQAYQSAINQSTSATQPYTQAGSMAISKLMDLAQGNGSLSSDPGIQYASDQAQKAILRAASARGNVGSARTMSELMRSAGDYAQTGYGQAYNRLANLAGIGQTATGQNLQTTVPYTAGIGNTQAASGIAGTNARTSGYQGVANALSGYLAGGGGQQISDWMRSLGA